MEDSSILKYQIWLTSLNDNRWISNNLGLKYRIFEIDSVLRQYQDSVLCIQRSTHRREVYSEFSQDLAVYTLIALLNFVAVICSYTIYNLLPLGILVFAGGVVMVGFILLCRNRSKGQLLLVKESATHKQQIQIAKSFRTKSVELANLVDSIQPNSSVIPQPLITTEQKQSV